LADSTLAKRADELVNSIDDDAVVWGVDPEAWLRETGRSGNVDDVRGLLEGLDMVLLVLLMRLRVFLGVQLVCQGRVLLERLVVVLVLVLLIQERLAVVLVERL
jgi:hypothetical protein